MKASAPPRTFVAGRAESGTTIQRTLHDALGLTHSVARGILRAGGVRRNGRVVSEPGERLAPGDRIEVTVDPSTRYRAPRRVPRGEGFRVVHEDGPLLVVDKEPGLITVPSPFHRGESLVEKLTERFRKRGFRRPRVRAAHRIDRFTSGLVVAAREGPELQSLRSQFASGRPERVYIAVAEGRLEKDEGRLVHRLMEDPRSLKVGLSRDARIGREASLTYRVLERFPAATLVEIRLETGRRNQIRVQFTALGHPLVGDTAYGEPSPLVARTALHASRLGFDHPRTGERLEFEAPLPEDLRRLIGELRRGANPRAGGGPVRGTASRRRTAGIRRR